MKRSRMLKAIKSHINQNNGVWDFTNDEGKPMGYIAVGKENFPVRDLALDQDNRPCFLVPLDIASENEIRDILDCM